MHARFFAPGPYEGGDEIDLPEEEAQHLTRVLRLAAGDCVRVFDGHGREFDAVVASASKGAARVRIGSAQAAAPEPRVAIALAHAVLKADKMDDVVRDAVMMGAVAIQPFVSARTEVSLAALERARRVERWTRVAISSAKQCGRAVVPPILEPIPFDAVIAALRDLRLPDPGVMFVEPSAGRGAAPLRDLDRSTPRQATVVIGPEGGWTGGELDQGASACRLLTIGGRTLRADAMGTVALASLFTVWEEF